MTRRDELDEWRTDLNANPVRASGQCDAKSAKEDDVEAEAVAEANRMDKIKEWMDRMDTD